MTLLIFDCDGVLVDSEIIALDTLAKALTDLGRPCDFAECRRLFMGKSVKDVLAEIEIMLGRPLPAEWGVKMNDVASRAARRRAAPGRRRRRGNCGASLSALRRLILASRTGFICRSR